MQIKPNSFKLFLALWAFALVLLHLIAALTESPLLWGLDSWSYFPMPWALILAGMGVILAVPATTEYVSPLVSRVVERFSSFFHGYRLHAAALVTTAGSGFLFWSFRCEIHLLGDGYWWIRNLEGGVKFWKNEPLALYLNWLAHKLSNLFSVVSAREAFQIVSVLSGVVFVYVLFRLACRMGKTLSERVLVFAGVFTLGTVQLFFGYVETYPALNVMLVLYLLLAVRMLQGEGSLLWPATAFWLCVLMHQSALVLSPSLGFLYLRWWKSESGGKKSLKLLALLFVPVGLISLLMLVIGLDAGVLFSSDEENTHLFIPFVSEVSRYFNYDLFSLAHLADLANLLLLLSPLCIPMCLLLAGRKKPLSKVQLYLLTVSICTLGLTALFNPGLGFPRDWDIFAYAFIAPAVLGLSLLVDAAKDDSRLMGYAIVVTVGIGLLHVAPWILVNADEERSLERYEHLLAGGTLHSSHAKAFGHEEVAIFYRERDRLELAVSHYEKAVAATPGNYRLYVNLANTYYRQNRLESAISIMKTAISRCLGDYDIHLSLSTYLKENGDLPGALHHLKEAIKINSDLSVGWYNLGSIMYEIGKYPEAAGYYRRAIELEPNDAHAHLNLGSTFSRLGLLEKAAEEYNTVLRLDPDNAMARHNLDAVQRKLLRVTP